MANIKIENHGNITIVDSNLSFSESDAKDELLSKLFYARHQQTMGGYKVWQDLIELYFQGRYSEMIEEIQKYNGRGSKTRNRCIELLHIIIEQSSKEMMKI